MDHELQAAFRHYKAGRIAEAEAAYARVLAHNPNQPDALHMAGLLAMRRRQFDDAVDLLRRAIRSKSDFPEAYNSLGAALEARKQDVKAENAYRLAIHLNPSYKPAYTNLAHNLRKQGRVPESVDVFRLALRKWPNDPLPHVGLGGALLDSGRLDEALPHYRRWSDLQPKDPTAHSDLLFWLLHDPSQTPETLFREHRRWSERHEKPLAHAIRPHANDRNPDRPLRIGYVSSDFRDHATARFLEPILAHHDPDEFAVVYYSDVIYPDELTGRFQARAAEWRQVAGMPDGKLAELIRADRIDILVDPQGHMGNNRMSTFARKPAPVQITYLYPHTTGLDAMDYRLTDENHDPAGMTDPFHTENLWRVEGGCAFCYRPCDDDPPVTDLPALANGFITFGFLNRTAKLNPEMIGLWAKVLEAVPASHLIVLANGGESNVAVRQQFERGGFAPARLSFVPTASRTEYLKIAHQVDILLDSSPYAGMTTTCDFLWMGVPVVTLAGCLPQSRAGATLLRAVGLAELVTDSPAAYQNAVTSLASDRPRLSALRGALRSRMQDSPLRDERGLANRLQRAYRRMWRQWCHGAPAGANEMPDN